MTSLRVCFTLVLAVLAHVAGAAPLPGAGSPAGSPDGGHAWVIAEKLAGEGYVLVHIPPRCTGVSPPLEREVRRSAGLSELPEGIAAWGDRVWAVLPGGAAGEPRVIFEQRVVPSAVGSMWVSRPPGKMTLSFSIEQPGRFLGAAAHAAGPILAFQSDGLSIQSWSGTGWQSLKSPTLPEGAQPVGFYQNGTDVTLLVRAGNSLAEHIMSPSAEGPPVWRSTTLSADVSGAIEQAVAIAYVEGRLVVLERDAEDARVLVRVGGSLVECEPVPGLPETFALAGLGADSRVVAVWTSESGAGSTNGGITGQAVAFEHSMAEVSVATGHRWGVGGVNVRTPVSAREFRSLAITMLFVMAAVLLLVVRGEGDAMLGFPSDASMATRGQRVLASLIDCVGPLVVASWVWGDVTLVLGPLLPGSQISDLVPLAAFMAMGFAQGTVFEASIGATPGKLLMRSKVVDVGGVLASAKGGTQLSLARSALRNAVKWLVPPVALVGLLGPVGRHRGDTLARACVVRFVRPRAD